MPKTNKIETSIYDFDGTLLTTQTLPLLLRVWKQKGFFVTEYKRLYRRIILSYVFYKLKIFGMSQANFRSKAMSSFARLVGLLSQPERDKFFEDCYEVATPFISEKVVLQLNKDKSKGIHTILLSGNYRPFLEKFKVLGFDDVIGSELYDHDGNVLNQPYILIGPRKILAIDQQFPQINWNQVGAYADAYYDFPILEKVAYPVCVNPDKKLLKIAQQRQWKTL